MRWAFPYPNTSLQFFSPSPKNIFSPNRRTRISGFGNKDGIWEHLRDHFPSAVTQLMDKPKAQLGFFWDGNSLPLGSAGWAVQTSDNTKIGFSHLFWSSLLLDFTLLYPVFSPCSPPKKKNPWIPSPSPKVPTDKQMYCKRDMQPKHCCFIFKISLVELSSY